MTLLINLCYIAASILFIFGIKMLGSATTARRGNLISSVGMLLAVIATLLYQGMEFGLIIAGIVIGSAIGLIAARRVAMTGMPEMVALFNGFGGLASLLVGIAEFDKILEQGWDLYLIDSPATPAFVMIAMIATILIGGITFTGSMVAYLKLAGRMSGKPILFSGQHWVNGLMLLAILVLGGSMIGMSSPALLITMISVVTLLSLALGISGVIPIGGGDMPVVIALLNSLSGLAASAAGFVILNSVLIVSGCLVGASGVILTVIMCKAMNRTLGNVLFSGFGSGAGSGTQKAVSGEMKPISPEDAYFVLEAAQKIVFVPGYGMAVAQAQHAVKELSVLLERNGAEVSHAIHPVAGRMPGHMNVLLAEADVPYEQLVEMEHINPQMPAVDVAIVIGANDVVNPAAGEDPASPIYGMPIINVHLAKTVFVLKRGQGAGFSGLENSLFFRSNCRMIYGDAKQTLNAIIGQFEK